MEPQDYPRASVAELLDELAAATSAPGGGAAAAVSLAMAAGLVAKSARFSTAHLADAEARAARADDVRAAALAAATDDAVAFGAVMAAYAEPRADDPDGRRDRIRAALAGAADVPLAVAEHGVEIARMAAELAGHGNANLRGDALAGAQLAAAAARAAVALAEINLAQSGAGDERVARAGELAAAADAARDDAMRHHDRPDRAGS